MGKVLIFLKSRGISQLLLMDVRVNSVCLLRRITIKQRKVWLSQPVYKSRINRFFTIVKSNCTVSM